MTPKNGQLPSKSTDKFLQEKTYQGLNISLYLVANSIYSTRCSV